MNTKTATTTEATITVELEIPAGFTEGEYLRKVAVDKFYARRITRIADDSSYAEEGLAAEVDRLLQEVDAATQAGQANNLLGATIYLDKNPDTSVSLARGSSHGWSHLMYALGLSDIDPSSPLLFERFLDPSYPNVPDIDTNFDDKVRRKTMKHLEKKYLKRGNLFKRVAKRIFKR